MDIISGKARFLPISETNKPQLTLYKKKILCTDEREMMIKGDYNSNTAQQLIISFNRCHKDNSPPGTVCKSEKEINEFIRGKYLVLLTNQIRFDSELPGLDAIIKESILTWYPVSFQQQLRYPHKISMTKLFSQDQPINMDDLTEMENGQIFSLTRVPQIPAEWDDWT